jgi:PAS domain S-box-containing protein
MRADVQEKTAALKQEIEERRRIFDTSPDLILVTDRQGKFIRVSPSSKAILGYDPEEMIGHSAVEFVYPDDLEPTREEMRIARRGQQMRNFETRYAHKEGRLVTLVWNGVWSEPAQQHFFIGRDMTESKMAEEAIIDSERMARGIIDTALDGFIQMDERGRIIDWNPQAKAIFGWSRDEAVGKLLGDLVIPESHRARHAEGLARFLRSGESAILGKRLEIEALRRDGRQIKVELSVTALRRRNEHVFNGFIRDLTEKIAAEEQFRHAQKMEAVGQLTGGIAHDFNNMLTVITGTIEILADAVADKPRLAAIAKLIGEAADRGAELTRHLLAFARKQPLQPRETDINALMVESETLLRPALGEHVEIELKLEANAWPALIDATQLTTALLNLAVNARDAMPDGGKLTLETRNVVLDPSYAESNSEVQPGSYVMIAVSDTGTGIPEALREKVFEPFFTTKEVGKGTGLGLSMVYGFVKQSGGHIKIYSEEGHGTTIRIYLPQARGHAERSADMAPAPSVEGGSETVLVVEDDKLVRTYVTAQLQSLGYKTLSAANAAEALVLVDRGAAFDLLLTDVIMAGLMNGRQLADEMAKRRSPLKVLFTSGYTENALIHHGRLDAGVLLLAKPYRKSDLARMVRVALDTNPASKAAAIPDLRAAS